MTCLRGHTMKDNKFFSPSKIENMSISAIRKEYSRLRSIANKRIQRLESQGLYRGNVKFPTIKEITESARSTISSKLADVSKFLRSDRTTVSGTKAYMRDFAEQMESKGYGDLVDSPEKIFKMIEYMESLREKYTDKLFDSGDALDVLQQGQRLNIPPDKLAENFDVFASNIEALENVKPSKNGAEFSQRRINNLIKKWSI